MDRSRESNAEREGRNREAADYDQRQLAEKGSFYWALHNRLILDSLVAIRPGPLLDAGCGTGLVTEALAQSGRTVVALDFSEASLGVLARKQLRGVQPVQGDLACAPLAAGQFAAVVSSLVIQHIAPQPRRLVLAELRRCLMPGGRLVLVAYNEAWFRRYRLPIVGFFGSGIPYYAFSSGQLREETLRAGFRDVHVRPLGLTLYGRGCPGGRFLYKVLGRPATRLERWIHRLLPPNLDYRSNYWLLCATAANTVT